MPVVSMKELLESGVHFGHRTHKWHPHMKPYIFTERNGIHIIDLQKTVKALDEAYNLVRDTVAEGGTVLFVGTKRQAQEAVKQQATRTGMYYVSERWLGGTLTNLVAVRGQPRIEALQALLFGQQFSAGDARFLAGVLHLADQCPEQFFRVLGFFDQGIDVRRNDVTKA